MSAENSNEKRNDQSRPRNLDVQALRGLAVTLVLLFHAGFSSINGYLGVDLFFVISGFVITQNLAREYSSSGKIKFGRFYVARARRLVPPLMYMIITTFLLANLLQSMNGQLQNTFKTYLGALFYVPNLILASITSGYFGVDANQNPLLHTWSLGVEEQFYFIFPLLLLLILKVSSRKTMLLLPLLVLLMSFSFCLQFAIPKYFSIPYLLQDAFYSPFCRFWEFIVGAITYFLASKSQKVLSKSQISRYKFSVLVSILTIAILLMVPRALIPATLILAISCLSCAAVILVSEILLHQKLPVASKSQLQKMLVSIGNASYSIYLWHWPFVVFSKLLWPTSNLVPIFATLLSLAPAYLSFKFIESRRHDVHIRTAAKLRFTFISMVSASAIIYPAYVGINSGWGQSWALTSHIAMQHDCDKPPLKLEKCTFGKKDSENRVIIAGDSQSWAIADGVINALVNINVSVTVVSHNNCPFIQDSELVVGQECADWNLKLRELIENNKYRYLIVSNSLSYSGLDLSEISNLLNSFESKSIRTILVIPPPGGDSTSSTRSLLLRHGDATRFGTNASQARNIEIIKNISVNSPNTQLVDPANYLCNNSKCKIAENGVEYYTDGNHLSVSGANLLVDRFTRLIKF